MESISIYNIPIHFFYIDETLPKNVAERLNIKIHPAVIDNSNHSDRLFKYWNKRIKMRNSRRFSAVTKTSIIKKLIKKILSLVLSQYLNK